MMAGRSSAPAAQMQVSQMARRFATPLNRPRDATPRPTAAGPAAVS
jgi:hypothetical protein